MLSNVMNKKTIVVLTIATLLIGGIGYYYSSNPSVNPSLLSLAFSGGLGLDEVNSDEKVYQGAVPQGYDLEHYRKTGETIKLK